MKNLSKLTALLATTLFLSFVACEKEGPAGPAGSQGEQGTVGEQGPKGDKGDTGTANVIYSEWFGLNFAPVPGGSGYFGIKNATGITADILNKGEVVVYMKLKASPHTVNKLNYSENIYWVNMGLTASKITLTSNYEADNFNDFRYVIIPGGVAASARADGLDLSDFSAVARTFDIPE